MPAASLQLKPAAAEILRSDAQVKVVFSGRRFGKTRLMLTAGIEECLKNTGAKVFYLAPSRKQAKDIAWDGYRRHTATVTPAPSGPIN